MSSSNTQAQASSERAAILAALDAWIRQRPGLDPRNYISHGADDAGRKAYRAEVRAIGRDLRDARELLRAVELRPSIGAPELRKAFSAFSGRLTWRAVGEVCDTCNGAGTLGTERNTCYTCKASGTYPRSELDYCTGQYWPTEYRAAACVVLASALWAYWRADAVAAQASAPKCDAFPDRAEHPYNCGHCNGTGHEGPRIGDRILRAAKCELSRGVVARWVR